MSHISPVESKLHPAYVIKILLSYEKHSDTEVTLIVSLSQ